MNKRIKCLDVVKAIGILAIIFAHLSIDERLRKIFYVFHVPLFFIVSGFFIKEDESFKEFFKKKCKSYLIPYICCSIILSAFIFLKSKFNIDVLKDTVIDFVLQIRFTTLWFLMTLFLSSIIFKILLIVSNKYKSDNKEKVIKLNDKTKVKVNGSDALLVIITLVLSISFIIYDKVVKHGMLFNFDTACISTIFLLTGYLLKKSAFIDKIESMDRFTKITRSIQISLLGFCIAYINYKLCHESLEMFECESGIFPLTIIAAIIVSIGLIILSSLLENSKVLNYLGKNTMAFFAFHQTIGISGMNFILNRIPLFENTNYFIHVLNKSICFIGAIITCFIMHIIIIKCKCGFVIGKNTNKKIESR